LKKLLSVVRIYFRFLVRPKATVCKPTFAAGRNARCQLFHVLGPKAVGRLKPDITAARIHETTVERQDMEVWVQSECRAEPLNDGNRTRLANAPTTPGDPLPAPSVDLADGYRVDPTKEPWVAG
jgi:hypothetical protein